MALTPAGEQASTQQAWFYPLPEIAPALRPVIELAPAQVLACKLAERKGFTPGTVRYISRIITTEAGIPRESQ